MREPAHAAGAERDADAEPAEGARDAADRAARVGRVRQQAVAQGVEVGVGEGRNRDEGVAGSALALTGNKREAGSALGRLPGLPGDIQHESVARRRRVVLAQVNEDRVVRANAQLVRRSRRGRPPGT